MVGNRSSLGIYVLSFLFLWVYYLTTTLYKFCRQLRVSICSFRSSEAASPSPPPPPEPSGFSSLFMRFYSKISIPAVPAHCSCPFCHIQGVKSSHILHLRKYCEDVLWVYVDSPCGFFHFFLLQRGEKQKKSYPKLFVTISIEGSAV